MVLGFGAVVGIILVVFFGLAFFASLVKNDFDL